MACAEAECFLGRVSQPCLWYDMTSLRNHGGAVTGIQRAIMGVAGALREARVPVRYCAFRKKLGFHEMDAASVDERLADLATGRAQPTDKPRTAMGRVQRRLRRRFVGKDEANIPFAAGDVLLNLGFSTYQQRHRDLVARIFESSGVRYVGFIYDLLMSRFPEWWEPEQQQHTAEWFHFTGRRAELVLCCSEATRRDAVWFFDRERIAPVALRTVRLADQLQQTVLAERTRDASARPFVLYVSTIEVRKNHRLLFQVWKRLLERHDPAAVPDLVFVGRKGWLVDDFLTELRNADHLGGRIQLRHGVGDAELAQLYADCLFTVYPSIAEGWGLPVAESLAHGKYCVASGTSSLPEVGGALVDYHDPFDVAGAHALIEHAIYDPAFRAERERAIQSGYRARTWSECAGEILDVLAPLLGAAGGARAANG